MKSNRFTLESALYLLAILLALGLRLLNLGEYPFQEYEAHTALNALSLLQADRPEISPGLGDPQPAYQALTWLAFEILGDHNLIARLWPALAGALLAFFPFFFRPLLGRPAALLLAFFLALDPGMITVARQADGRMMGLCFTLVATGLAYQRKLGWAGFFLGLALLSGPAVIPGLAALVLAMVSGGLLARLRRTSQEEEAEVDPLLGSPLAYWKEALIPAGVTIFLVASLFFRFPPGLSSWAATLPVYFRGWVEPSAVPAGRLLVALLVYQPLGVIFGVSGALRGWLRADRLYQRLSFWFLISLFLTLVYPARQVSDLIWTLVPLLTLAALEISPFLAVDRGDVRVPAGMAALVLLLLAIFWLNLLGLGPISLANQDVVLRLVVMAGILVLVALTTVLIGLGWSWLSAGRGVVWGLCLALGIYGLANVGHILQPPMDETLSLWDSLPGSGDTHLFVDTIKDLSNWQTGRADGLDILVAVDSAAMRWSLRNFPGATYIPESQVASIRGNPSLLVTRQTQAEPSLAADYRGQDFSWWIYPDWPGSLPPNLANWIAFRRAPQRQEQIILWARNDLFPGEISPEPSDDQVPPQLISPEEIGP